MSVEGPLPPRIVLVLVALALSLAACGGGSSASTSAASPAPSASSGSGTPSPSAGSSALATWTAQYSTNVLAGAAAANRLVRAIVDRDDPEISRACHGLRGAYSDLLVPARDGFPDATQIAITASLNTGTANARLASDRCFEWLRDNTNADALDSARERATVAHRELTSALNAARSAS